MSRDDTPLSSLPDREISRVPPSGPSGGHLGFMSRLGADLLPSLGPGLVAVAGITVVAVFLGRRAPVVGAPVFAILIGVTIALFRPAGPRIQPGLRFASKRVLQAAIVFLGFNLSLSQVIRSGTESLPVLIGSLVGALLLAYLVGRWLRVSGETNLLIGVGTAICGASAIAATNAVIDADEADVSYSIATIFTFNIAAVLIFPLVGRQLGLSEQAFGLWAGTAINDTSSVVAATNVYGAAAEAFGVVVKLTRSLAIVPISLVLAWRRNRQERAVDSTGASSSRVSVSSTFPMFILLFLAAVAVNSSGVVPTSWQSGMAQAASWMIAAALAAIGLSTRVSDIRRAGFRPILLGGILWVSLAVMSLGLQAATGHL